MSARSLAERLGFPAAAKLLIVNCDELGFGASANRGRTSTIARDVRRPTALVTPTE